MLPVPKVRVDDPLMAAAVESVTVLPEIEAIVVPAEMPPPVTA